MKDDSTFSILTKRKLFSASLRIIIPLYATFILFALSIFLVFVPMWKTHMMDQKKEMIRELTDSTWSLLSEYDLRVKQGELTLENARQEAINQIRTLRYGVEGKDYFWINDMHPRMVMHPYFSELEGQDLTKFKDPDGKFPFVDMLETVRRQDSGYVNYMWQWKDDPGQVAPKISFVKKFSPWGWIIGTGIYIEDIQQEIALITRRFVKIFAGVLGIVILMSAYITWQAVTIEQKKNLAEKAKHFEELRLKKLLELNQMSDVSLDALTEFALEEAIKLTQSDIGYLAFLNKDETQLTIHTGSRQAMNQCGVSDEKLVYPVEETGLWGDAVKTREAVIINDYDNYNSPQKKGYPQGHVKISCFMSIPVFDGKKIIAVAGVGNKNENYNESDVRQLQLMMDGMWKIIQRKKFEDDLRKSEERYRLLAENATDNIWVLQLSDFKFSYMSPSVEQLLGYTADECMELEFGKQMTKDSLKSVSDAISEEVGRDSEEDLDDKRYRILELELIKKDGSKVWTEVKACFLRNENGIPDRILGISRDLTERRHLEQKFRQTQKMEALGTLAGGIAHDFNNILSSVLGFAELAKLGLNGDEETKKNLDQVLMAGIRARDLVKHILTFSRRADAQKDLIQITPLIKECLKFLRASIPVNIEIRQHFEVSDSIVMADLTQIHQVLMNLFTNAAYAMKEKGGVLDFRLRSVEIQACEIIETQELKPGRYLQLVIADTGCGIPKEEVGRIFEPFFTTKKHGEGTGMGLSAAYGIIMDMGGAISVYSEPGMGTTFQVLLREHQGDPVKDEASVNYLRLTGRGRILLVDDEASIVDWTRQVLLKLGYTVVSATGSLEALDIFKKTPNDFDLVLTDLAMPDMTGIELSGQIKAIQPDIPIILCTGFSEGLTSQIIEANGILDMVMKPVIASELAQVVSKALKIETKIENGSEKS